jgi:hypothetical protein
VVEFFQESAKSGAASAPSPAASVIYEKVLLQLPFADLHANLCSTNLQVNSPYRIASALLQPFVEQRKRLLLVTPTLPTTPAMLTAVHDNFLCATTDRVRQFARAHGQRIVVVFPVSPTHSYSLQTTLTDTSVTQVTLHYQDPRYEPRRRFLAAGATSDQAAFGSMGGWKWDVAERCGRPSTLRDKRTAIPNPQRLENTTNPHVSGVKTTRGSRSVTFPPIPSNGKIGTGISMYLLFQDKHAAPFREEKDDEKSLSAR